MPSAFDLFRKIEPSGTPPLLFERGELTAIVVFVAGSWQWSVFGAGSKGEFTDRPALAGGRGWNMDAMQACREAVACIEREEIKATSRF
jgi:hypothetical protein